MTKKLLSETWTAQLKRELLAFHSDTGMKLSTIGAKAIKNARMWERLEAGGSITLEVADTLRAWMADYKVNPKT